LNPILFAILLVSAIGLIAGLGLSIASAVMAVPVDEKTEQIRACLPGANCGACGFSGCDGYADALSKGETTETGLCGPGGKEAAEAIAEITGLPINIVTSFLTRNQARGRISVRIVPTTSSPTYGRLTTRCMLMTRWRTERWCRRGANIAMPTSILSA
jgi:RnfABCDGE-type electron transport complex B subunit